MRSRAKSIEGWAVALPLVVVAFLFVAAPGFMDPMFDTAVRIAGLPAGLVLLAAGGAAIALGALAWRTVTHRAGPGLGEAITMVLVAGIVLVAPMLVLLFKGLGS